jgi:hypothetical protein
MKVICIDDTNRPNEIPLSKWVKKGTVYSVKRVWHIRMKPGTYGLELDGFDMSDCFPYLYFSSVRFAPISDDKAERFASIEEQLKKIEKKPEIIEA